MTVVLGLNAFHPDSSACLLRDGELVAAVEEERFQRVKHWAGLPERSIRYCLEKAQISLADVSVIAVNSNPKAGLLRKLAFALSRRPDFRLIADRMKSRARRHSLAESVERVCGDIVFTGKTEFVEHHVAHLASAFYCSPFDEAVALSVDGSGDFASTAWGCGTGTRLRCDGRIYFPHSLGIFYETITHHLGFKKYGDEYKVMGLAAYGEPVYLSEMERVLLRAANGEFRLNLDCFSHHSGKAVFRWDGCAPSADDYFTSKLVNLLGPPREPDEAVTRRHENIACSAQLAYENALFVLLNRLYEQYGLDRLVLSGGCAFNSVANGKIAAKTRFREIFIQPAAGDAGGALGAALYAWHRRVGRPKTSSMRHAFWGPEYSESEITTSLARYDGQLSRGGISRERMEMDRLVHDTATAIAEGEVVGWFQGRMEWGPRALGNRSILADPRRSDIRALLNDKIKRRESFRPFAPAVLKDRASEWFEGDLDVPFMMKVLPIRADKRERIPAVCHVDGTGRVQTVDGEQHPLFYQLIEAFYRLTGVPMLLNTSFNENEPIVSSPEEALECFFRTRMDRLVLGNNLLCRRSAQSRASEERHPMPIATDAPEH